MCMCLRQQDMAAEQLDEELLEPAAVPSTRVRPQEQRMPSVPAGRVPAQKAPPKRTPEEDELEALQAEMAL